MFSIQTRSVLIWISDFDIVLGKRKIMEGTVRIKYSGYVLSCLGTLNCPEMRMCFILNSPKNAPVFEGVIFIMAVTTG